MWTVPHNIYSHVINDLILATSDHFKESNPESSTSNKCKLSNNKKLQKLVCSVHPYNKIFGYGTHNLYS